MPSPSANRRIAMAALVGCLIGGCYDGESLVEKVRANAVRTRMDEVAIGEYRLTLPRDTEIGETTEVHVRMFGESERFKIADIKKALEANAALIEDQVISALRESTRKELTEPSLMALRTRLLAVLNAQLDDQPLDAIGFYEVRFMRH